MDQKLSPTTSKVNLQSASTETNKQSQENGRPTKYTDETVNQLIKSFEDGATITEACRTAQISRETYYEWGESQKGFSDKMREAQEYPDAVAKMVIVRAMKKGDVDTSKWWAERRIKSEFSTRQEHTGNDGESLFGWQDDNNTLQPNATPEGPAQFKE